MIVGYIFKDEIWFSFPIDICFLIRVMKCVQKQNNWDFKTVANQIEIWSVEICKCILLDLGCLLDSDCDKYLTQR